MEEVRLGALAEAVVRAVVGETVDSDVGGGKDEEDLVKIAGRLHYCTGADLVEAYHVMDILHSYYCRLVLHNLTEERILHDMRCIASCDETPPKVHR